MAQSLFYFLSSKKLELYNSFNIFGLLKKGTRTTNLKYFMKVQ